jgi:aminoglycoside 3-N-acetyltransferase
MDKYVLHDHIIPKIQGIEKGDTLYIVSDILRLSIVSKEMGVRFDMNRFVDSIQERIGRDGNILIPVFNWGFCRGETFDIRKTISRTGALGNAVMKRKDFKRSKHPIYSFMVWGRDQELLTEMDPVDSFGSGTIFEYMYEQNAKVLVIDLPALSGVTYIHHAEQMTGVPYRYNKEFRGMYVDREGNEEEKGYCMYVRDLDMDPKHINGFQPLEEKMKREGLIHVQQYHGVDFSLLKVRDLDEAVKDDILNNDSRRMYVYNGQS